MNIVVIDHYSDREKIFSGEERELVAQMQHRFGFLKRLGSHVGIPQLLAYLNKGQRFSAYETSGMSDMQKTDYSKIGSQLGHSTELDEAFKAARFMAGHSGDIDQKKALRQGNGNPVRAALVAFGLPVTKEYIDSLMAIMASKPLKKSESPIKQSEPVLDESRPYSDIINGAIASGNIEPLKLSGKHTQGALLATDMAKGIRLLLKPGSGHQSPAVGAEYSGASQSKREAAFWSASQVFRLERFIPETHLVMIDGQEYAAIRMLPDDYHTMLELQGQDKNLPRRLLHMHSGIGDLHKWAAMDFVLGNSDRHAQNVMAMGKEVRLIDHGSALSGPDFSPSKDEYSFVPFYLRAFGPEDLMDLSVADQMRSMPRAVHTSKEIGEWLLGIDEELLKNTLFRYGIDPGPSVDRLRKLKSALNHTAPDLAIIHAWLFT